MTWLLKLVQARGGSTMRLIMVVTFLFFFIVYGYSVYLKGELLDIPENWMKLLVGISAAKVGQKWVEAKNPNSATNPTAPNG